MASHQHQQGCNPGAYLLSNESLGNDSQAQHSSFIQVAMVCILLKNRESEVHRQAQKCRRKRENLVRLKT